MRRLSVQYFEGAIVTTNQYLKAGLCLCGLGQRFTVVKHQGHGLYIVSYFLIDFFRVASITLFERVHCYFAAVFVVPGKEVDHIILQLVTLQPIRFLGLLMAVEKNSGSLRLLDIFRNLEVSFTHIDGSALQIGSRHKILKGHNIALNLFLHSSKCYEIWSYK